MRRANRFARRRIRREQTKGATIPPFGCSISSTITFRGQAHITSRVYHYRITNPAEAGIFDDLADAVLAQDRLAHGPNHAYKLMRVWGPTDAEDKRDNIMRVVEDLTGNGAASYAGSNIYPELAYVVTMFIGRSPTSNRKVFLKKFIHPGMWKSAGPTSQGTEAVPAADKTFFKNWFEACKNVGAGGNSFDLCSPRDQIANLSDVAGVANYLHVRQLTQ